MFGDRTSKDIVSFKLIDSFMW